MNEWYETARVNGEIVPAPTAREMKFLWRDYVWAVVAFLRGKILRQQAYRPQGEGSVRMFRPPCTTTIKRVTLLMRLWGLRGMTVEELLALQDLPVMSAYRPLFFYNSSGPSDPVMLGNWSSDDQLNCWSDDDSYRFHFLRN